MVSTSIFEEQSYIRGTPGAQEIRPKGIQVVDELCEVRSYRLFSERIKNQFVTYRTMPIDHSLDQAPGPCLLGRGDSTFSNEISLRDNLNNSLAFAAMVKVAGG
jgi:hypothetical protein